MMSEEGLDVERAVRRESGYWMGVRCLAEEREERGERRELLCYELAL
jgi:hypothetical protein